MKWITDDSGNRCSVERFGSEEAAREALTTLKNCSDCSDCSHCSHCSHCSRCSRCSGCSDCSDCSGYSGYSGSKESNCPPIPTIDDIHQKIYEAASAPGSLEMTTWHTCNTTHCRAGWVVALAGEQGKALENFHDTPLAAMLIYRASGYDINPARFYDSNEDALADMKRLANGEKTP